MPNMIRIETSGNNVVDVVGECIASVTRQAVELPCCGVGLMLRIWSQQSGGFVPIIHVTRADSTDAILVEAEFVESPQDVENFFSVFEPSELASALRGFKELESDLDLDCLYRVYDRLVGLILAEFSGYLAGLENQYRSPTASATGKPTDVDGI